MNRMTTNKTTQVVIVGAGPCGVTLANYLGLYGVSAVLIDRSTDILDYPRAVGVDDEALRSWQGIGLADELHKDMIQNAPARYHNSKRRLFAQISPNSQPFGWPRRNMFLQPLTERGLREGLERFSNVRTMFGAEVTDLHQNADYATVTVQDTNGVTDIQCDFVVGADGGKSTVRKLTGIALNGKTNAARWLVVDVINDPLYAPFSSVFCHPKRPSMSIDLPYGYRRFEFMLLPDENEEHVVSENYISDLMCAFYPEGSTLPEVKRARVYQHHSRIAERFRDRRVFLAGDAAHLQPPFFGQGMNSGIRDATNLAWKLAWVLNARADEKILDSYEKERRHHAYSMVQFATWIGSFYQPKNRPIEWFRDLFFKCVQSIPSIRDYVLQLKFKPMPRYTEGIVIHSQKPKTRNEVGRMFMQPMVLNSSGVWKKLDDAIGPSFAVLAFNFDPTSYISGDNSDFLQQIGARVICIQRALPAQSNKISASDNIEVLEDSQGSFRDWLISHPNSEVIILRPDRYIAAAGRRTDINMLIDKLHSLVL